jgi:hypothetical protein
MIQRIKRGETGDAFLRGRGQWNHVMRLERPQENEKTIMLAILPVIPLALQSELEVRPLRPDTSFHAP